MDMTTTRNRQGFFRGAIEAFIAARHREADRYLSRTLLSYDDRILREHGYERGDLERRARYTL
jgi:hypothetical protein